MRILIQRVRRASVTIEGQIHCGIGNGLLVLVGIEEADNDEGYRVADRKIDKTSYICRRIRRDEPVGRGNRGRHTDRQPVYAVCADQKRKPAVVHTAARPETAIPLYERFVESVERAMGHRIETGVFGADMQVELVNDGPVTIWIDSKNRE